VLALTLKKVSNTFVMVPVVHFRRLIFGTRLPAAQMVEAHIGDDAVQPGIEGTVAAKLRQGPIGLDEGLLGNVLRLSRVAHIAHDQLDEFVLVLEHQRIERPLVPALHAAYQAQITCIGAHARPLLPIRGPPCRALSRL